MVLRNKAKAKAKKTERKQKKTARTQARAKKKDTRKDARTAKKKVRKKKKTDLKKARKTGASRSEKKEIRTDFRAKKKKIRTKKRTEKKEIRSEKQKTIRKAKAASASSTVPELKKTSTAKSLVHRLWRDFDAEIAKRKLSFHELESYNLIPKSAGARTLVSIGESLLGHWDRLVKDGWGSLNARMLKRTFKSGTIVAGFKRTWVGPAPVGSNIKVVIAKRIGGATAPGRLGGTITLRKYNRNGTVIETKRVTFKDGKYAQTKSITIRGDRFGFILVVVDTPHKPGKTFKYAIKYTEQVIKADRRKVSGFADIHVHQTAELSFGGKWYHGSHTGAPSTGLRRCRPSAYFTSQVLQAMGIDIEKKTEKATLVHHGTGYPDFKQWPHHNDRCHHQAHEQWLRNAHRKGLNIMFSCAINNEPLSAILSGMGVLSKSKPWRDMPSLELQIDAIHRFAQRNRSWCAIAYNPWHAREIIHESKLAIVIAVECSNLFPPGEGDLESQLEKLYAQGARSIQIVHETDNRFAGCAPQEKVFGYLQTLKHPSIRKDHFNSNDKKWALTSFKLDPRTGKNTRGLNRNGEKLVKMIIDRHMLLDAAHYSQKTLLDVFQICKRNGYYPLINSHTKFEELMSKEAKESQREFVTTKGQLKIFKETGGIVGLRTGPYIYKQAKRPHGGYRVPPDSDAAEFGTAKSYAQLVTYARDHKIKFAFGSDINGFITQLGPRKGQGSKPASVSSEYWNKGLHHIGMLPELLKDLKSLRTPGVANLESSAEHLLKSWERTWERNGKKVV